MLNSNYNNHYNQKMNIQIEIIKRLSRIPFKEKILTSPKIMDNPFDFNGINDGKTLADESGLKVDKSPNKYKNLDDEIIEDMQRQMHISDSLKGKSIDEITDEDLDKIITPEHKRISSES